MSATHFFILFLLFAVHIINFYIYLHFGFYQDGSFPGVSPIKVTGVLVVPFRGLNLGICTA